MPDQTTENKPTAPNPFDPEGLRITGDVNSVGAEKVLLRIAVRKALTRYPIEVVS